MEGSFLGNFPAIRTGDPGELLQWLAPVFAVRSIDMPDRGRAFEAAFNHYELPSIGLSFARYGGPVSVRLSQNDFFCQGFPTAGHGEVRWNGRLATVGGSNGGVAGGPGSEGELSYGGGFAHLIVKFSPAALTRKLSSLIGEPLDRPLQLDGGPAGYPSNDAGQRRLIEFLASELDRKEAPLPPLVLAELEQAVLVGYLMATAHTYSHLLQGTPRAAAPWQVRRAVDYIEANWSEPITIEALLDATQTSARSLFHLFKRTHGVSPMVYVKRVRLRHARQMLSNPAPNTTVTAVGFLCGFGNLGHFARDYFNAFGEHPSETLKSHR